MRKLLSNKIIGVFASAIFWLSAAQLFFACRKDEFRAWQYYLEPPPPPTIARITYNVKNCVPPYPVSFQQSVDNPIGQLSYKWDFGDGTVSTAQNPSHIYSKAGTYWVKLTVANAIGADTDSILVSEVREASIPVSAAFQFGHVNSNNFAPTKVIFENRSSGANQFYWFFGDGGEFNGSDPEYVFRNPGNYNVRMRGTCTNGVSSEASSNVLVLPPPRRVFIDSINLMLPEQFRRNNITIEVYHNSIFVGRTFPISPGSYPIKLRKLQHFNNNLFFDFVQFTNNEVFKFLVFNDATNPVPVAEILLSSIDIQNRFYPRSYFQIETIPRIQDTFIDLYLDY